MKKLFCLLLVLAMIFNLTASASASEPAETEYIEITAETVCLREGPGQDYHAVATLQRGDCVPISGYVINQYGNTWFQCEYGTGTAYLYAPRATFHDHQHSAIAEGIYVCKCGDYYVDESSPMVQTSAIAATAGTLLTAEAVAAAAQLSAAGTAVAAGLSAAFPIVATVAIGGLVIYMAVNSTGTQIQDVAYIRSEADVEEFFKNEYDSAKPYYKACLVPNSATLLRSREGMDLDTAAKYLKSIVTNPAYMSVNTITNQTMANIWCYTDKEADALGKRFEKHGSQYGYGSSTTYDCYYEDNEERYPNNIYFSHYHLWYRSWYASFMKKVDDIHIFFGLPTFAATA